MPSSPRTFQVMSLKWGAVVVGVGGEGVGGVGGDGSGVWCGAAAMVCGGSCWWSSGVLLGRKVWRSVCFFFLCCVGRRGWMVLVLVLFCWVFAIASCCGIGYSCVGVVGCGGEEGGGEGG